MGLPAAENWPSAQFTQTPAWPRVPAGQSSHLLGAEAGTARWPDPQVMLQSPPVPAAGGRQGVQPLRSSATLRPSPHADAGLHVVCEASSWKVPGPQPEQLRSEVGVGATASNSPTEQVRVARQVVLGSSANVVWPSQATQRRSEEAVGETASNGVAPPHTVCAAHGALMASAGWKVPGAQGAHSASSMPVVLLQPPTCPEPGAQGVQVRHWRSEVGVGSASV